MTEERKVTLSWHFITFAIGIIFGAGILWGTVANFRQSTYSHEDGKVLELKVQVMSQEITELKAEVRIQSQNTNDIKIFLATGKWPNKPPTKEIQ